MSLLSPNDLLPDLSYPTQAFLRSAYGLLLLGTLLCALPHGRRFFRSERWGGYAKSSPAVDFLQNPYVYPALMAVWIGSAVLLVLGVQTVLAALVNLVLCYYHFIWMRWRGVLRGMGAPGFMSWWLAAAVFLLELTLHHAPQLRSLALLVLQVDYALIMFSAGIYKLRAGYAANQGMEHGMVNPEWGYWHRFWKKVRPSHPIYWVFNQLAWSVEVVAAVLMLVPATRFLGAMMIILSFVFIATQIRLCLLTEMVIIAGMVFFCPGTLGQQVLDLFPWWSAAPAGAALPGWVVFIIGAALTTYLVALPLAHGGLFWNFYARKRLPRPLQTALEAWTNAFGIIIWRVFSADHTSFFLRIWRQPRAGGERVLISEYDRFGGRFNQVAESITVTSVFTSLKYYPSNSALFVERLLRYARTLPCSGNEVLVFEYVAIRKRPEQFEHVPVAEFIVDVPAGRITERPLAEDAACLRSGITGSPLKAGTRPGSYAA